MLLSVIVSCETPPSESELGLKTLASGAVLRVVVVAVFELAVLHTAPAQTSLPIRVLLKGVPATAFTGT